MVRPESAIHDLLTNIIISLQTDLWFSITGPIKIVPLSRTVQDIMKVLTLLLLQPIWEEETLPKVILT